MMGNPTKGRASLGMSLLEVLVGIVIFSIGIMALSQLQGSIARSAGDANTRTVAVNIAEDVIERNRGFSRVSHDPDGILYAYEDIAPAQYVLSRGDLTYNVAISVVDYWYNQATQVFTTTEPMVAAFSDFKLVTVNVDWGIGPEFNIDDNQQTTGRLGSGSVALSEVVSSMTSAGDAKSATGGTGGLYLPSVNYNPGTNPEIVSISLGNNKFKESTTPLPKVIRADSLVETTFDVVTYSQNDEGATFLRREEFRSVSCNCSLQVPSTNAQGGFRPTVWDGAGYTKGEFVSKPYGLSTSNVQSKLCTVCCRDHHDSGFGTEDDPDDPGRALYDPFRVAEGYFSSGALAGDHKHYLRNTSGGLSLASVNGSEYMEACRMVRKDGFWKVGQDLRQEGLNVFPENYLDGPAEVAVYAGYITDAVAAYESAIGGINRYELTPPSFTQPAGMNPQVIFPASTSDTATTLPTPLGIPTQQLRSRGIYVDYMSKKLRTVVDCLQAGGTGISCEAPHITTPLEIIPFYETQLTWLSRWNETPPNNPADVTNQSITDNNTHSRGNAVRTAGTGSTIVDVKIHPGNLGLTATDPIDPNYIADLRSKNLYMNVQNTTPPPGLDGFLISGLITSNISGFKASDVEISTSGAQCSRTNTGYKCLLETGSVNPRLTVGNYYKMGRIRIGCSSELITNGNQTGSSGWTRFDLPHANTSTAHIVIKENNC